jgi:molecular chaperone HtpG
MTEPTVRPFKAEVSQLLELLVNSLYSNHEVFVRELISNASDALDKLRFESLSRPELLPSDTTLKVQIVPQREQRTLTFWDNGIGMTEQELEDNLGTLARSGTRAFAEALKAAQKQGDSPQLIGQFGVGFYSAFLVADRVEVVSRAAGGEQAFRWVSDAKATFSVSPAERDVQGTTVVLHLKEDQAEYLEPYRLRQLIERYSDYIPHPIELQKEERGKDKDDEKDATKDGAAVEFERVNQASALWRRPAKELTKEQYEGFYKHLTHDWEAPIAHRHFQVEGTQMFYALLFLPKRPSFDLFDAESKHGVRLHVKRVFVADNCSDLVPRYLRFMRGVVDSEDLPLNVSREVLQDSRAVRLIKKQITNHALSLLEELRKDDVEAYDTFWGAYGTVLKEGLHFAETERARIAKLVQYESSAKAPAGGKGAWTNLEDYVSRMKSDQKAIYYAAGPSRQLIENSPHLEGLRKRGYEILYMTDPIDPFAISSLNEFEGKPLINAMTDDLKLEPSEDAQSELEKEKAAQGGGERTSLLSHMKTVLGEKVAEVRASKRLTDSPTCLVIAEGGMAPHIEQMLRARKMDVPANKRILEVNTGHPVVVNLEQAFNASQDSADVRSWIRTLYDQALIAEGSPLEDPADFARRLTALVERATAAPAA